MPGQEANSMSHRFFLVPLTVAFLVCRFAVDGRRR